MSGTQAQQALEINLPEGTSAVVRRGNLCVAFSATGESLTINGQTYFMNETSLVHPVNDQQKYNLVQRAYEVGQRLRDGTVVLSVDIDKNEALFVPAKIFGGKSQFEKQSNVVQSVNDHGLHGHKDWRRITDDEGETLSRNWGKIAPEELQGRSAPFFWLGSPTKGNWGGARMGGHADVFINFRLSSNPVPVVRSGPALSLEL